ncbi:UNVERIFIED_CONTAM: hypothetical protein FKN15_043372 [Acipenser sinensis]
MGRRSRQRQQGQQHQKLLPPQLEDPASLFPWCSWCGKVDHRWRSCPDGPPADWCGRCEVDGHNWAGCPHNPDQEQLQTPSSAATPPLPTSPPSPPSQEIWDWLMHPEADLFHDLPIAINTLWRRDGGRWEKWEAEHHPASFAELALMVVNYLAVDMGDAPFKVELPSREPEREEPLPSREPEVEEPLSREPEGEELPSRESEGEEPLSREPEGEEPSSREPEGEPLPSREPEGEEPPSREPEGEELPSREPEGDELPSREPEGEPLPSQEPEGESLPSRELEGEPLPSREPEGEPLPSPREGEPLPLPREGEPERPQPEREEPERGADKENGGTDKEDGEADTGVAETKRGGAAADGAQRGGAAAAGAQRGGAAAARAQGGGAAASGAQRPLPEPRGEEPPLPEPRGEEPPLPEPRGEEPPLPEPRGEEPRSIPPPQPRPPPLQSNSALLRPVPQPLLLDTLPVFLDLPVLDLEPRSLQHWVVLLMRADRGQENTTVALMQMCDGERMNPNQQSPSRPVRALYNRNCGLHTEWLGSSFRGQSEAGHSGRGRHYGTWSHRPSTTADEKPGATAKSQPGPESTQCTTQALEHTVWSRVLSDGLLFRDCNPFVLLAISITG